MACASSPSVSPNRKMSTPKKVARAALFVSYHFPPCTSIGMRRTLRFVRGIGTLGWRSVILTVRNQDYLREPTEETASVYRTRVRRPLELALRLRNQCRQLTRSKNHSSGHEASGAQASSPGARSWVQRWIDPWFSTPDAQVGWLPSAVWKGWRAIGPEGVAVIYSSGPPYSAHLIAWALKKLSGRPWVADFRDPWSRRPWDQDIVNRTPRYRVQVWMERVVVLTGRHPHQQYP